MNRRLIFIRVFLVGAFCFALGASDGQDLSTPRKAAIAFMHAMSMGDVSAAKTASAGSEEDYQYLQSLIEFIAAGKDLQNAAINRFGESGKAVWPDASAGMPQQLQTDSERIDRDTATVGSSDGREPMSLRKIDGAWKVDLALIPQKKEIGKAIPALKKIMRSAIADINAGKYKSADEAQRAIQHEIFLIVRSEMEANDSAHR